MDRDASPRTGDVGSGPGGTKDAHEKALGPQDGGGGPSTVSRQLVTAVKGTRKQLMARLEKLFAEWSLHTIGLIGGRRTSAT